LGAKAPTTNLSTILGAFALATNLGAKAPTTNLSTILGAFALATNLGAKAPTTNLGAFAPTNARKRLLQTR
jgi:hypothetical protein